MPYYSRRSQAILSGAHPDLQRLFNEVIKHYDHTVYESVRSKADQNYYYDIGATELRWPDSKHNVVPPETKSKAVDAAPYESDIGGIDWSEAQCRHFGAYVCGVAAVLGIKIRWGGDWDGDNDIDDQTFNDLVHFELID